MAAGETVEASQADAADVESHELIGTPEADPVCIGKANSGGTQQPHVKTETDYVGYLDNLGFWYWVMTFISVELGCFAMTGDSFFGVVTGGVVESLRLSLGREMTWHMCCGSAMWMLGFVQVVCRRWRKGQLAWIHRSSGRAFLLLWFAVVGPTAAWLSLMVGIGKARAHLTMAWFAVAGMDTTLLASYYFWRALLIAQRRARGAESLTLHGRAMRLGIVLSTLIVFQRPIQFLVIAYRKMALTFLESWRLHGLSNFLSAYVFDHHVILSLTTVLPFGWTPFLIDGPWSSIARKLVMLKEGEEQELLGSSKPGQVETYFWKLRLPAFVLLRMVVTQLFTEDPSCLGQPCVSELER